jgi:hypothetical protein
LGFRVDIKKTRDVSNKHVIKHKMASLPNKNIAIRPDAGIIPK